MIRLDGIIQKGRGFRVPSREDFWKSARKPRPTPYLIGFSILGIAAFSFVILNLTLTKAESISFSPSVCLGTWENPQLSMGSPETFGEEIRFTAENSSRLVASSSDIFCGSFIPAEAEPQESLSRVGLMLIWRIGPSPEPALASSTDILKGNVSSNAPSTDPLEETSSSTAKEFIEPSDAASTTLQVTNSASSTSSAQDDSPPLEPEVFGTSTEPEPPTEPLEVPPAQEPNPQIDPEPALESTPAFIQRFRFVIRGLIPFAFAEEVSEITPEPDPVFTEEMVATSTPEETIVPSTIEEVGGPMAEEDIISSTDGTTSSSEVTEEILLDEQFLKISYSVDGKNWFELARVSEADMPNFTVSLPIDRWDDLTLLQIGIERIPTSLSAIPEVYLDGMWLEIEYEKNEMTEEIIAEEPHIASPPQPDLTAGNPRQDIQEGSVRAVITEQGGMRELWYASPVPDSGTVEWTLLTGDSAIDPDSPLGLRGNTIFWLDKNKQMIFGYFIDDRSIFGKPTEGEGDSYLEFQSGNEGLWKAIFDSVNNTFYFIKS